MFSYLSGSIIVVFEILGESPEDLNNILSKLESMIEGGGVLDILGIQLPFSAGALQLGGSIGKCVQDFLW